MQNKLAQPRMALKGKPEQVFDFTLVPVHRGPMDQSADGRHRSRAIEPEADVNPGRPRTLVEDIGERPVLLSSTTSVAKVN